MGGSVVFLLAELVEGGPALLPVSESIIPVRRSPAETHKGT